MIVTDLTSDAAGSTLLHAFYQSLYTEEFPDANERELEENMRNYLGLREEGWYGGNNYHILILQADDGQICGGVVADYFEKSNIGMIEFMVVPPAHRGQGLGRRLLDEITKRFEQDATRAGHSILNGICGEVNDPYRRCEVEEHLDGFARMKMWDRFGFGLLDFPYIQPALSEGQEPVHGLGLMFCPRRFEFGQELPSPLVVQIIRDYQIWAMRIDAPEQTAAFQAMELVLRRKSSTALLNMRDYICEEPAPPFTPVVIRDGDTSLLGEFAVLYNETFSHGETAVAVSEFNRGTRIETIPVPHHYWLWGLRSPGHDGLAGLASFFSFGTCGFGGYLALAPHLRGRGLCRRLLRLMERQIVEVNDRSSGWYVECEPSSDESTVFQRCGFHEIPMTYRQPRLHTDTVGVSSGVHLELLYKPFGRVYRRPALSLEALQTDLRAILTRIYYLDAAGLEDAMQQMTWPKESENVFGV